MNKHEGGFISAAEAPSEVALGLGRPARLTGNIYQYSEHKITFRTAWLLISPIMESSRSEKLAGPSFGHSQAAIF